MNVEPLTIAFDDARLGDLRRRLLATNWVVDFANDDRGNGVNGAYLREPVAYWIDGDDWRGQEREINGFRHFRAQIDGTPIHFIRTGTRSEPDADRPDERLAVDLLGLSPGHPAADGSGIVWRRFRRCIRGLCFSKDFLLTTIMIYWSTNIIVRRRGSMQGRGKTCGGHDGAITAI